MQDWYPQDFSNSIAESKSLNVFICAYSVIPDFIYPPDHSIVPIKEAWLEHQYVLTHPSLWGTSVSVRTQEEQLNISFGSSVKYLDSVGSTLFSGPNIDGPMWKGSIDFVSLPYKGGGDIDTFQYVFSPYDRRISSKVLATFIIKKQVSSNKK
ncbi:MAG: hypothetical protein ABSC53_08565 [Bacteroidota bacterium]